MNGRLYDPALKRFLSPDNFVQDPYNTQNFNRYGYVLNNPLLYTDPSGEFIFGIIAVAIIAGNSSIGILAAGGLLLAAAILDKGVSNLAAGNPFHWGIGKAGVIGLASSALTFGIGDVFGSLGNLGKELFRAGAHGLAGGMFSVLQGGKFEHGFAAGFVSSLVSSGVGVLGPRTEWKFNMSLDGNHTRELVTKGIQNKALMDALTITAGGLSGGISSAIAGGNFWQGATQGAIVAGLNHLGNHSRLRNGLGDDGPDPKKIKSILNDPTRPDSDGSISLSEANNWYRNGSGEPLYQDLSKVDLSFIKSSDFKSIGEVKTFQTLFKSSDGLVFGQIRLKYLGDNKVTTTEGYFDTYNFERHNNRSVNPNIFGRVKENASRGFRNFATLGGRMLADRSPFNLHNQEFKIYFYGQGTISQ